VFTVKESAPLWQAWQNQNFAVHFKNAGDVLSHSVSYFDGYTIILNEQVREINFNVYQLHLPGKNLDKNMS